LSAGDIVVLADSDGWKWRAGANNVWRPFHGGWSGAAAVRGMMFAFAEQGVFRFDRDSGSYESVDSGLAPADVSKWMPGRGFVERGARRRGERVKPVPEGSLRTAGQRLCNSLFDRDVAPSSGRPILL
jgi:hypothetical protein